MTQSMDELKARCDRALGLHGIRNPDAFLAELQAEDGLDVYGKGGAVEALEAETMRLLGKAAAVFMPSGTMAQQIALRIHCDRRNLRAFAGHPTTHLELHEDKAYQRVHDLVALTVGDWAALITMEDLEGIKEPLGAFLFELPQREIGGRLPEWAELEKQTAFVRDLGAAIHLDGARLWECTPYYGKELHEIAALFDSVYVSFYKGLGGLSGCCLAGDQDVIDEAREWRHRHGGTLWSLWPLAASGLGALRKRLPLMPRYYEHALAIADALRNVEGVEVVPDPLQAPMMHLHLRTSADSFVETARSLAEKEGIWTWAQSFRADTPSIQIAELSVGDATLEFTPSEVAEIIGRFVSAPS